MRVRLVLGLMALALPVGALAAPLTAPVPESHVVTMSAFPGFSPAMLQVPVGHTVTWVNTDNLAHTVTALLGAVPDSGNLAPGASYSATFTATGQVLYRCTIHPWMVGLVNVQ